MNTTRLLALLALGSSGLFAASAPVPLILWDFNEGDGGYAANHGSAGEADLFLRAPGGGPTAAFSVAGKGVSGKNYDYAFDLTTATGMGATTPNSVGPAGVVWSTASALTALSDLSSFTVSGWLKPTATLANGARIFVSPAFTLLAGTEGRLTLQVNGQNADVQSEPALNEVGTWIFFAVTYDGTRKSNNVTYYVGSVAKNDLHKAGVATINAGPLKPFKGQIVIGNNSSTETITRPFMGLIDQIAFHASKADSSGALSSTEIEAVRANALR